MKKIPIGIASSVSAEKHFDPLDTMQFAKQENFDTIQLYISNEVLHNKSTLMKILDQQSSFSDIYYHAEGFLNNEFYSSEYYKELYSFLANTIAPNYIIHFDEHVDSENMRTLCNKIKDSYIKVYVENYFIENGKESAQENLKKYQELFALSDPANEYMSPAIDVPRIFHKHTGFAQGESLIITYRLFNFFRDRGIRMLLHIIDSSDADMARHNFCAIGSGIIPYGYIFQFIINTELPVEGIILEYEDKFSPLESRDFLQNFI